MLRVDLKALLQISMSTPGALQIHKRIQLKGNVSYIICCELHDGLLTIKQARRLKLGRTRRRTKRQQKGLSTAKQPTTVMSLQGSLSSKTSKPNVRSHDARVDTQDLKFMMNQYQQTSMQNSFTIGTQTRQLHLVSQSTQIGRSLETKTTQTQVEPMLSAMASTMTDAELQYRNCGTQTTQEQDEDEDELLSPHLGLLHQLLIMSNTQGQLLMRGVEGINQLIECKTLEIEKQSLEATTTADVKQLCAKSYAILTQNNNKFQQQLKPQIRSARFRCGKFGSWPKRSHRHRHRREQTKQAETTATQMHSCKATQTEQLSTKVAANLVTATQRHRDKGFLWLRRSS
ncbi:uncharacterized protein LOC133836189 [Drosophila sulfurigaster albostrigata]|uniref:uncharacterized protein LOC133836189 n=1 Tax=Drosophila sulfurigaster albostrigata TaxID=89887 RepID=UPI002D21A06E|nr:uncharacterized protein LOC133836189 [Drosophila sulfurigaster albostrigata]